MNKVRIAFDYETLTFGVEELTVDDLTERVNSKDPVVRQNYIRAEYVEAESPYTSWEDIRKHGYSCRAFCQWNMR